MTLLEMTQNILSAMSSDEVNSISDTVESLQVAEEIRNTYNELFSNRDMGTFESLINLESPGNTSTPHLLILPSNVAFIKWIKYKDYNLQDTGFKTIKYLAPEEFIQRIVEQTPPANFVNVTLTDTSSVTYPIASDKAPDYYTIFDESQMLVFDSFDSDNESYLTGANSFAWGSLYKTFELSDSFVAPIEPNLFPLFLAEAKSACFINIKESASPKEEQRARRQLVRSQTRLLGGTSEKHKGVLGHVDYSKKR